MEQSKKLVCNIPKKSIQNTKDTEATIADETYSDKQVSTCADEMIKLSISVMNEEDKSKTLRISSIEKPVVSLKKKLLVLDVNGLLADIVFPPPKSHKADAIIVGRAIFKRPFYLEFLNFCFEKFEVGVWSSRTKKNIDAVIDYLMGKMKHRLLFCWDLSHCTATSFKTLENKHKPLVFKDLRKIWEKQDPNLPWEKGYYNESNTLLLDDSPYKALLNPPHNSIFPHTFRFQNQSDNSLAAGGDLRLYLYGLANVENMLKYVEQHQFGQERVTKRSQSWKFYVKVIDSLSARHC
ncbi:uncharacterized protein LOC133309242 [Gastrolobium bilobum]|uniref:uncharacterized protein LOC133309242 n=1 Tax=Gastrolobium bilobum TaxID=150636 RepID=UPI002AB11A5F|nr:uncharacterized protein LOC133309242 [Gastrolobium bilobum]